jgi:hypothetical protein
VALLISEQRAVVLSFAVASALPGQLGNINRNNHPLDLLGNRFCYFGDWCFRTISNQDAIQKQETARSVPEKLGRIGRYKTATVRRAFVAAARFVGGQFFWLTL